MGLVKTLQTIKEGHFAVAASSAYGIGATDRLLQFAPFHFDTSMEEIVLALCQGATLLLREDSMLVVVIKSREALTDMPHYLRAE